MAHEITWHDMPMEELTALDASTMKEAKVLIDSIVSYLGDSNERVAYYAGRLEQLLIDASMRTPADSSDTRSGRRTESLVTLPLTGTVWET